jgi:hypothetical protein
VFRYLASWLSSSAEFFESTGLKKAAETRPVRWCGAKPTGSSSRNARIFLAPEELQDVKVALRPGYGGPPARQCGNAVAALVAHEASGMCRKRSRNHGVRARESNGINFAPRHL